MDAARLSIGVSETDKTRMLLDYLHTSFNMHLGLVDTKSLRSKTIYWAHRLLKENNDTGPHILRNYLKESGFADNLTLPSGTRYASAALLGDGGYAQVSWSHVEALLAINHTHFRLNDLNLSLLWRMMVTTTQHATGQDNRNIPWIAATILCCRGAGLYSGATAHGSLTYQALDKPNSAGKFIQA